LKSVTRKGLYRPFRTSTELLPIDEGNMVGVVASYPLVKAWWMGEGEGDVVLRALAE
jgi:hypothetical protein